MRAPQLAIILALGALAGACASEASPTPLADGGLESGKPFECCKLGSPSCHGPVSGTNPDGTCRRAPQDLVPLGWTTRTDERGCPYYVYGHMNSCLSNPGPDTSKDQRVGSPCSVDPDCGPSGITKCSTTVLGDARGVCVRQGCDQGLSCDGDRGICVSWFDDNYCLPRCTFGDDGAPPVGCAPGRACWPTIASKAPLGIGQCVGACATDAECTTGWRCQTQQGLCTQSYFTATKSPGDACTSAAECWCLGYCTQACRIGGDGACPSGLVCDPWLPSGFTTAPKDLAGVCSKVCTVDADCTALNATCVAAPGLSVRVCRPK